LQNSIEKTVILSETAVISLMTFTEVRFRTEKSDSIRPLRDGRKMMLLALEKNNGNSQLLQHNLE
jgi:hypothetical protein